MKIDLKNGYAVIKDVYTRGMAKNVNEILLGDVEMESGADGQSKIKGFNPKATEKASDYVVMSMLEELNIGGEKKEVTIENLDCLSNSDYQKIKKAIDELAVDNNPKA
jgi:hypothetical protein